MYFLATITGHPVVLRCCDYLIDALSPNHLEVSSYRPTVYADQGLLGHKWSDTFCMVLVWVPCVHRVKSRPTWHSVPLYARWIWWLSFIHSFMHPLECIMIVIVITMIKGKALELDSGLRCLRIKVHLTYRKLQGFLMDLIRWVELMGPFYLSLW